MTEMEPSECPYDGGICDYGGEPEKVGDCADCFRYRKEMQRSHRADCMEPEYQVR